MPADVINAWDIAWNTLTLLVALSELAAAVIRERHNETRSLT